MFCRTWREAGSSGAAPSRRPLSGSGSPRGAGRDRTALLAGRAAVLALTALTLLVVASGSPVRADFDQAMAYFKAGNFLEAAAQFQAMVDTAPGYDYGHYMLGQCLLRMDRPTDAETSLRRAISLRGDKPEYLHALALAFRAQRRYVPALIALQTGAPFVRDARTAYAYLILRAWTLASLRRWGDAASDLEKAVALRRDPALLEMLGKANFAAGRYERAAVAFGLSLSGGQEDPLRLRMLAESLLRLAAGTADPPRKRSLYGQAANAAERLRRAMPQDPRGFGLLGRAALGEGRLDVAEENLRRALAAEPGSCSTKVNLSRDLVALGRLDEAERWLLEATSCAPAAPEVHEELGAVYFRQQQFRKALDAFRRANQIQPSSTARAGIEATRVKLEAISR